MDSTGSNTREKSLQMAEQLTRITRVREVLSSNPGRAKSHKALQTVRTASISTHVAVFNCLGAMSLVKNHYVLRGKTARLMKG